MNVQTTWQQNQDIKINIQEWNKISYKKTNLDK